MSGWVVPATLFVLMLGSAGVTTKIALRAFTWQELVLWSAAAYAVVALGLGLAGTRVAAIGGLEGLMGAITAFIAPLSLMLMFKALNSGDATRVVPFTSAYPLITVALAVAILHEPVTRTTALGIALVIVGVVLLTLH
jgi:transporter family protein